MRTRSSSLPIIRMCPRPTLRPYPLFILVPSMIVPTPVIPRHLPLSVLNALRRRRPSCLMIKKMIVLLLVSLAAHRFRIDSAWVVWPLIKASGCSLPCLCVIHIHSLRSSIIHVLFVHHAYITRFLSAIMYAGHLGWPRRFGNQVARSSAKRSYTDEQLVVRRSHSFHG